MDQTEWLTWYESLPELNWKPQKSFISQVRAAFVCMCVEKLVFLIVQLKEKHAMKSQKEREGEEERGSALPAARLVSVLWYLFW